METDDVPGAVEVWVYECLIGRGVAMEIAQQDARGVRAKLQRTFGGARHYIRAERDTSARDSAIVAAGQEGRDPATIAREHGTSERTVQRVLARHFGSSPQETGFGSDDWVIK